MTYTFKTFFLLVAANLLAMTLYGQIKNRSKTNTVLYDRVLNEKGTYPEIIKNELAQYTTEGLKLTEKGSLVKLNYYYSLAERVVQYHVKFSGDAKAVFQSDKGDFKAFVDVSNKSISIGTDPLIKKKVDFIDFNHEYLVEVYHSYQVSKVRIKDLTTGKSAELEARMDGPGGFGAGVVNKGLFVGLQHDYYCFGLQSGSALWVRRIVVLSKAGNLKLLLYGDSITEPESYFPTIDFVKSWTQLIMNKVKGGAMSSGRGGTTIYEVLERIKNELPYIKSKYVMVTIGTNGGNTEENLGQLVEYILSQGSIPILNNIPSNESGSQVPVNAQIEKVRLKYGIKGCKFDWVTSLNGDGKEVDQTTMWLEDYGPRKIYHHPNVKGSMQMYKQTVVDVPEIYK